MASSQEKTEKPTEKRLRKARERGQIPKSREINAVGILLAGGAAVSMSTDLIREHFHQLLEVLLKQSFHPSSDFPINNSLFLTVIFHLFVMLGPTLLTATVAGVGLNLLQIKEFMFSFEAMQVSLSNVNPLQGFKKLFSLRSLTELVKSLLKLVIVSYGVYSVLNSERDLFLSMIGQSVGEMLHAIGHLTFKMVIRVGGLMILVSLLDYYYQKWQHQKDMMMTKQEIREEHKETEGNPQIKSRIRSIQRFLAKQRMLSNVPKASMVITNPTHFAVALVYKAEMEAPQVVAKGIDFVARKIIKIARKHGVPVIQNPPLARALYKQVNLQERIPVTLYRAVAKVLAYLHQQKQKQTAG